MIHLDLHHIHMGDVPTWLSAVTALVAAILVLLTLRSQKNQLAVQKTELNIEIERNNERQLRRFVDKFSFWLSDEQYPQVHFINESVHPIYEVTIHMTEYTTGKIGMVSGSDGKFLGIRFIPQGKYVQTLQQAKYDLDEPMEIHFTDSSGVTWSRSSKGTSKVYSRKHRYPDVWLSSPRPEE